MMYLYKCPHCGEYDGRMNDDGFIYCMACGFKFERKDISVAAGETSETKNIRLNLGCGDRRLPGYWGIDIDPAVHTAGFSDEMGSACCLCQYDDNSVDEIYASHILDHLSRNEQLDNTLAEWHRVLKPGGILRVAVSDFEKTAKMYNEGVDLERLWGAIVGGQKTDYDSHRCAFDFTVLRRYLEKHGFVDVKRYDWREFLPKDFSDNSAAAIPKYDLDGYLMSLNVQCMKIVFPKED